MPKEKHSFPDMLVTVFRKGNLLYIIALCFFLLAFINVFCNHCHLNHQTRMKRGTSTSCGPNCVRCDGGNGCLRCAERTVLHTAHENRLTFGSCLHQCPPAFHTRWANGTPSVCIPCNIPNCAHCDGSPNACTGCRDGHYLFKNLTNHRRVTCVKPCPKGFRKYRKRICIPRKVSCKLSKWRPARPFGCHCINGKWQKHMEREVIREGERCNKNVKRLKLCKAPRRRSCPSASSSQSSTGYTRQSRNENDSENNSRTIYSSPKTRLKSQNKHKTNNYKKNKSPLASKGQMFVNNFTPP